MANTTTNSATPIKRKPKPRPVGTSLRGAIDKGSEFIEDAVGALGKTAKVLGASMESTYKDTKINGIKDNVASVSEALEDFTDFRSLHTKNSRFQAFLDKSEDRMFDVLED